MKLQKIMQKIFLNGEGTIVENDNVVKFSISIKPETLRENVSLLAHELHYELMRQEALDMKSSVDGWKAIKQSILLDYLNDKK